MTAVLFLALALLAALPLALAALRSRVDSTEDAAKDLALYKKQLEGVTRDLDRGVISSDEADRMRVDISRRILAADNAIKHQKSARGGMMSPAALAAGLLVVVIGGGAALYWEMGVPGMGDIPRAARIDMAQERYATRPNQAHAESKLPPSPNLNVPADFIELVERLRKAVADRPTDTQGLRLLAQNEARLGNFKAAYETQAQLIAVLGDQATAEDHFTQAALMIEATGGSYVSPEAEQALRATLARDTNHEGARFYVGVLLAQNDRPDLAFDHWNFILQRGAADGPWMAPVRENIEELAWRAGEKFTMPPPRGAGLPGPDAAAIANAQNMTDEDRQSMIEGMVERLSDRLATEGGSADEWARLIGALGVLGRTNDARDITTEALATFANNETALAQIRQAAQNAGLQP